LFDSVGFLGGTQMLLDFTTLLFYTDPGSGALLMQLIAATLLGGLFYFRRLKDFIFRKSNAEKVEQVSPENSLEEPQK
jgi:hypothetical protein